MKAASPAPSPEITIRLVHSSQDDSALPNGYGAFASLRISQCEKSRPTTHTARMILAFSAHLAPGQHLDQTSALSSWVEVLQRAGIAMSFAKATIPSRADTERCLASVSMSLTWLPPAAWPQWGLKGWLEAYRRSLSNSATRLDDDLNEALTSCDRHGSLAPLESWLKVWSYIGVMQAITVTLLGKVNGMQDLNFSQCEIVADPLCLRVSVHLPFMRGDRPHYILAGYLGRVDGVARFGYHAKNRSSVPSLDIGNLLSNHSHPVINCEAGMLPIGLIPACLDSQTDWVTSLQGFGSTHVMGLNIAPLTQPHEKTKTLQVLDVINSDELLSIMNNSAGPSALSRRMPGISPTTWMCDFTVATGVKRTHEHLGVRLVRFASPIEASLNRWLNHCAELAMGTEQQHRGFRTAKSTDGRYLMLGAAEPLYTRLVMPDNQSSGIFPAASVYRVPVAGLIAHLVHQEQILGGVEAEASVMRPVSALKAIAADAARFLAKPQESLRQLIKWLLFDAHFGLIEQVGFRYQIVLQPYGYGLAALPFWELGNQNRETAKSIFGYSISSHQSSDLLLNDTTLSAISGDYHSSESELFEYRARLIRVASDTGPAFLTQLITDFADQADTEDFRSAKNRVERVLSKRPTPYTT